MLKYIINNQNINRVFQTLNVEDAAINGNTICITSPHHNLRGGDILYFNRKDGDATFSDNVIVESSDDSHIYVPRFTDRTLQVNYIDTEIEDVTVSGDEQKKAIFNLFNEHTHITDKTSMRTKLLLLFPESIADKRICRGDYIIQGGGFLHQIEVNGDIDSISCGTPYEQMNVVYSGETSEKSRFYVTLNEELADALTAVDTVKYYVGDKYFFNEIVILLDDMGYERRNQFLWKVSNEVEEILYDYILNNYYHLQFGEIDERFYTIDSDVITLSNGVHVNRIDGDIHLTLPLGELFATNLQQEDRYKTSYIEDQINAKINGIVDYEKRRFEAVVVGDEKCNTFVDATDITINLHLRQRPYDNTEYGRDYGDWDSVDWLGMNYKTVINYPNGAKKPDTLGDIGFDDGDIYYQKKCLQKSFVRLLFYDTNDRRTQKLLFYSTLFFDSNLFYKKYIQGIIDGITPRENYTFADDGLLDDAYRMSATFRCGNMFNDKISSEGFYLYLFPNIVTGTSPTTIYMKVEFNHAKYGKTLSLTIPQDGQPEDYWEDNKINMQKFLDDTYLKICVKYDEVKNRHIWYIPNYDAATKASKEIVIDCYEPILKKIEEGIII